MEKRGFVRITGRVKEMIIRGDENLFPAEIAAQKTPSHWIEVSEWRLTGSGKIQKFELRNQWLAAREAAAQD